jgi:phospholipid/cholesterol/gamma-HCH transport system ATP-binding protein
MAREATTVASSSPKIEFRDVHKRLGRQHILRGLSLSVYPGESLVILGRSGGGKSVLLKHLIGLIRPDSGEIFVDGEDITKFSERDLIRVRRKITMVFQGGALFDSMTVGENVAFPLREERCYSESEIRDKVKEMLEAVGLPGQEHKMPSELSGGMKKRVALARSVIRQPEVILYDEPTAGLDPIMTANIDCLIKAMQSRFNTTSITITHDMNSAFHIADRIAFLKDGKIHALGTPEEISRNPDPAVQNFIRGVADETVEDIKDLITERKP